MIVLWFIVFVVCCGECLGLCLLLLHSRSLSPCVCRVIHAHVSPSPSHVLWCLSVCLCEACHMHCVWWLALSNTLPCCAPSSLLFSFCPSLFHHHHPKKHTGVWREEREKGVDGEREEEEEERCDAKTSGEKGAKREKEITTPGVPRLSPTLVLTRPEQA